MRRLEFLPHHFLLCSIGEGGVLRYQVRAGLSHMCSPGACWGFALRQAQVLPCRPHHSAAGPG